MAAPAENKIYLCIDSQTLKHPEWIGLEDEKLDDQPWLKVFSFGKDLRRHLALDPLGQMVFLVSADDVDTINLGAAIQKDDETHDIHVVAWKLDGSFSTRARAAHIKKVLAIESFVKHYKALKQLNIANTPVRANAAPLSTTIGVRDKDALPTYEGMLDVQDDLWDLDDCVVAEQYLQDLRKQKALNTVSHLSAFKHDIARSSGKEPDINAVWKASDGTDRKESNKLLDMRTHFKNHKTSGDQSAYLMLVCSGCGGVGKSSIAYTLAYFAHKQGYRTLLIDGNFQFGSLSTYFDEEERIAIDRVYDNPLLVESLAYQNKPVLLSAPERIEKSEVLNENLDDLIALCEPFFDLVILDTASYWPGTYAKLLKRAHHVLYCIDQRRAALLSLQKSLDLCKRCAIPSASFTYILNRCTRKMPYRSSDIMQQFAAKQCFELKEFKGDLEQYLSCEGIEKLVSEKNSFALALKAAVSEMFPVRKAKIFDMPPEDARFADFAWQGSKVRSLACRG